MSQTQKNEAIEKILGELNEKFDHRLQITTPLDQLPGDLRALLLRCYEARTNKPRNYYFAAIINGIYTENLTAFLMSQNLLQELVKNDPNIARNTVDSKSYREFMAFMLNKGYVRLLSQPERIAKGSKPIAGKWEWIHEPTLNLLKQYLQTSRNPPVPSIPPPDVEQSLSETNETLEQEAQRKLSELSIERDLYIFTVGPEHSSIQSEAKSLIDDGKYSTAIQLLDSSRKKRDEIYPGAKTYTQWRNKTLEEAISICRRTKKTFLPSQPTLNAEI